MNRWPWLATLLSPEARSLFSFILMFWIAMTAQLKLETKQVIGRLPGHHLLITGGRHGDEFEPMAAIRRLIKLLDPLEMSGRVTLVPVVNQAAFERGSRTAEDGLDLARVCPGKADGTSTEQAAAALSMWIRTADFYIDLHTGGMALDVLPLVGYTLHPDPKTLQWQRRMARAFNMPVVWGTTPKLEGRSLSVARDAKVPAIYAENHGGGSFRTDGVEVFVKGCRNVMIELGMIPGERPTSHIELAVEDPRPESGHMQVCNPSPTAGFFEPSVQLGQNVQTGDLLGTVSDALGHQVTPIHAKRDGLVIVLRTLSPVQRGTSLAVILNSSPPATLVNLDSNQPNSFASE